MTGLLIFARCAGFLFRAPGFSHPSVPSPVRAGLAVALASAIVPRVPHAPHIDGAAFLVAILTEFFLGAAIGMTASLVYDGAYAGGRIVDDYVGVKAIAPSLQLVAPSGFGRIWSLAFTGGFFLSGAYRPALVGLVRSFDRVPPGTPFHPEGWIAYTAAFAGTIVVVAAQIAGPAVAMAFVVQIALGVLSRVVPRFGSFTLTFPLAFAAALVITVIGLPLVAVHAPTPILAVPMGPR
ncbi:MAG: flagellar biosynthetic protein FliR [Candidatus Eremiobacteraeota bacterium]|nr:flagellar biosynthetic protein FliR [Candidatus Eremiobacteraeota bacterium]